jgi:hypothetical protein
MSSVTTTEPAPSAIRSAMQDELWATPLRAGRRPIAVGMPAAPPGTTGDIFGGNSSQSSHIQGSGNNNNSSNNSDNNNNRAEERHEEGGDMGEEELTQAERECFDELSLELEQLEALKRERESLEDAMRLVQRGGPKLAKPKKKGPHPHLRYSPFASKLIPLGAVCGERPATGGSVTASVGPPDTERPLRFSARDVGTRLKLYHYRVDAWYEVQVVAYDAKSSMHRVKYANDGAEQWHQMEGRKMSLLQPPADNASAASTPAKASPAPEVPSWKGAVTRSGRPSGKALPALELDPQADDADILGRLEAEGLRYERSG